jgi:hypothetical protein
MTRPEVFAGLAQNKFDDKLELKDQPTIDFVKMQLTAFEKYITSASSAEKLAEFLAPQPRGSAGIKRIDRRGPDAPGMSGAHRGPATSQTRQSLPRVSLQHGL